MSACACLCFPPSPITVSSLVAQNEYDDREQYQSCGVELSSYASPHVACVENSIQPQSLNVHEYNAPAII